MNQHKENVMPEYDPDFIGPIRAPDYLLLEFQIIFIRSVLKSWLQPEKEHFAYRDDVRF